MPIEKTGSSPIERVNMQRKKKGLLPLLDKMGLDSGTTRNASTKPQNPAIAPINYPALAHIAAGNRMGDQGGEENLQLKKRFRNRLLGGNQNAQI